MYLNMSKQLRKIATVLCGLAVCFFGFSSCAEDQDDFFNKHRQDIVERDKEDAAIRNELTEEIGKLRAEITHKIDSVEGKLKTLLDNGGMNVLSDLAKKSSDMRDSIGKRYKRFNDFLDEKFGDEDNAINDLFSTFDNLRDNLQSKLQKAISDNNEEEARKIRKFISDVDDAETNVNIGKQKMLDLQNSYKDLYNQSEKLLELEGRLRDADNNITKMLQDLPNTLQAYKDSLSGVLENYIKEQLQSSEYRSIYTRLHDMNDRYDQMLTYLGEIESIKKRIEDITDQYAQLSNDAADLEDLCNDIDDAWNKYDDAVEILQRLEDIDIESYESLPSDYENDIESAMDNLRDVADQLDDWKKDMNDAAQIMADELEEVETAYNTAENFLEAAHGDFDDIPFP